MVLGFVLRCFGSRVTHPLSPILTQRVEQLVHEAEYLQELAEQQQQQDAQEKAGVLLWKATKLNEEQTKLDEKKRELAAKQKELVAKRDAAQEIVQTGKLMAGLPGVTFTGDLLQLVTDEIMTLTKICFDLGKEIDKEETDLTAKVAKYEDGDPEAGTQALKQGRDGLYTSLNETMNKQQKDAMLNTEAAQQFFGAAKQAQPELQQREQRVEATNPAELGVDAVTRQVRQELENRERKLVLALEQGGKKYCGALCIGFDSESRGFASALARIFYRVSCVCNLGTVPSFTFDCVHQL